MINQSNETLYKTSSQKELNQFALEACKNGNMKELEYLLFSSKLTRHARLAYVSMDYAVENNNLEMVVFLLDHFNKMTKNKDTFYLNILSNTMRHGSLPIFKYILTLPFLTNLPSFQQVFNNGFMDLLLDKQKNILEYILDHPHFSHEKVKGFGAIFGRSLQNENYELVDYLYYHPFFPNEVKQDALDREFKDAIPYPNKLKTLEYIIFNLNLQLSMNTRLSVTPAVNFLFEKRKLNNQLHSDLSVDIATSPKKIKI